MNSKQMRELIRNPIAYQQFLRLGKVPELVCPEGPLINVLKSMTPRERLAVVGLTVGPALGYQGSRIFNNAEQALRWCAPESQILAGRSWPAESWRIKSFHQKLCIGDVLKHATKFPEVIGKKYGV
jgi:hypothetical protein